MASSTCCLAQWARCSLSASLRPQIQCPNRITTLAQQHRTAAVAGAGGLGAIQPKYRQRKKEAQAAKRKKPRSTFIQYDLRDAEQFSLCDAMRYIQAFEVGYPPTSPKYELHLKLRTQKDGANVRNRIRLPHAVKTDLRIAVICPADSADAASAREAGASLVGEEEIFSAVKEGRIEFDRCICLAQSLPKLQKAGVARILGPRGLMPSDKMGTVTRDVAKLVRSMAGGSEYREREGVVRMAVGQLGFAPDELRKNIKAFIQQVKKDMADLSDRVHKELHEVVLSSTHSPGFSLTGEFTSADGVRPADLAPPAEVEYVEVQETQVRTATSAAPSSVPLEVLAQESTQAQSQQASL